MKEVWALDKGGALIPALEGLLFLLCFRKNHLQNLFEITSKLEKVTRTMQELSFTQRLVDC